MSNFWEGLGSKLADQWTTTVLTPAFAFWAGGFLAWITHAGWGSLRTLEMQFSQLSLIVQIALLIGGLLVIAASSIAVQRLDLTTLRLLEGYWPRRLKRLRSWCVDLRSKPVDKKRAHYDQLVTKEEQNNISPEEHEERVALELELRLVPINQKIVCRPS